MITPVTHPLRYAVAEMKGGMSVDEAAAKYGLPFETIARHAPAGTCPLARLTPRMEVRPLANARVMRLRRTKARKLLSGLGVPLLRANVEFAFGLLNNGMTVNQVAKALYREGYIA